MAKVRVPGVDLPENDMWQVVETELMDRDDYHRILDLGWPDFFKKLMRGRILNDVPPEYLPPLRKSIDARVEWRVHGIPVLSGGDITTPIELLCGARSLMEFAMDLLEIPDTVAKLKDKNTGVMSIGPAGENQVLFASIADEKGRSYGTCYEFGTRH